MTSAERRLDIIGLGVGPRQLTPEARIAWQAADIVFSLTFRPNWTSPGAELSGWPAPSTLRVDLYAACDPKGSPQQAYASMSDALFAMPEPWRRAVLVTDGNPMLLNDPVRRIFERARGLEWQVTCYPAVSSIDTVMVDLGLRVEEDGLQIVETARMLLGKTPIRPELGCLLLQVSVISPRPFGEDFVQPSEVYAPLQRHLRSLYPKDHPFYIVRSPLGGSDKGRILLTSVHGFPNVAQLIDSACSGYLPPFRGVLTP